MLWLGLGAGVHWGLPLTLALWDCHPWRAVPSEPQALIDSPCWLRRVFPVPDLELRLLTPHTAASYLAVEMGLGQDPLLGWG